MAFIQCTYGSQALRMSTTFNVLLPDNPPPESGWPVLWLFHGLSDDHTIWCRRTSIERYLEGVQLAVVMPAVQRSFYTNQVGGLAYLDFVSDDLPRYCRSFFHFSGERSHNFTAGLSMGGYGAMKVALTKPENYSHAASLSGVLDVSAVNRVSEDVRTTRELETTFGDLKALENSEHDVVELIARAQKAGRKLPRLFACCGTEDYLYDGNHRFLNRVKDKNLDLHWEEGPGAHNWHYWDAMIQKVIDWLPVERPEK
jgi:putative tributyrin esterase